MLTNRKVILSGDVIHYYEFPFPVEYGNSRLKGRKKKPKKPDEDEEDRRREDSVYRAKKRVKHLLQSNAYQYSNGQGGSHPPMFYTFTFREDVTELKIANKQFGDFIKRLNYDLNGNKTAQLKYLCVPEIQHKREKKYGFAVWHFHVIFFNLPYRFGIKAEIEAIWSNGFVFAKSVNDLNHLTNYVAKYFTKETQERALVAEKAYFCSQGLKQPITIYDDQQITALINFFPKPTFEKKYPMAEGELTYKCFDQSKKSVDKPFAQENKKGIIMAYA